MIIVTCVPPPGYDSYRCGWREEEREGKRVRVGLTWQAGTTELADDALSADQIEMLKRDPGKRITIRQIPGVEPHGTKKEPAKKEEPKPADTKKPEQKPSEGEP